MGPSSETPKLYTKAYIRIAAKQHHYSITSSAMASTPGGMARLTAVFKLITRSNLVGCRDRQQQISTNSCRAGKPGK
jgi:hypothetical protein